MVQLVPDGTIFIHIALILLMIWILNRTFFRPINQVLQSRERNKGGQSEAAGILGQVGEKTQKYDAAMREARNEGYQLVEEQRVAAMQQRESQLEAVKAEVAQTVSQEKDSINKQTAEARQAIAADAQKMADKISSSILKA